MARINYMNLVVGVGAGVVDEVLERKDTTDKKTAPFKGWRDYTRLGLTVAGLAGQIFDFMPSIAEPLAQSEVTLLTKSLAKQFVAPKITMQEISSRYGLRQLTAGIPVSSPAVEAYMPPESTIQLY